MLMPTALTTTVASRVPVYLDTPEMDSPVQVCTNNDGSFTCTCLPGYTGDGLSCTSKPSYIEVNSFTVHCNPCNVAGVPGEIGKKQHCDSS